jgi:hypothetical protein
MTPAMLNRAQQADENRAYVRALLWKHQPEFAAALAAAEQSFSRPARRCRHCATVPAADHAEHGTVRDQSSFSPWDAA